MKVGIPKEIKPREGRVGLIPAAVADMVHAGHSVSVEQGAGVLSGYTDADYQQAGATIVATAAEVYGQAELIVKVKEPVAGDLALLEARHTLFCYLHLAPNPDLTQRLLDIGLRAIAFETVSEGNGLPLLAPMSEIAGRVAVDAGSHYLHQSMGGRGLLLGGVPGTDRGRVVVLGAGVAGYAAAASAAALGAQVDVFDRLPAALQRVAALGPNVTAHYAYRTAIADAVAQADLLIGAVLIPGARAPRLITRAMIETMPQGSVVVDISIDQGGCVETMRPTNYDNPIYEEAGVWHMGVTNLPGAVPRTSSQALSGAVLPYALRLADAGRSLDAALQAGVNVDKGLLVHPALKETFAFGSGSVV